MPSRTVIVTTIQSPTEALRHFSRLKGWRLLVVGDRKTPADWSLPGADFLSAEDQQALAYRTPRSLPWNHYARKTAGYLAAIASGAQRILDSDDDNRPVTDGSLPAFDAAYPCTAENLGFVNLYPLFSDPTCPAWPRGFPLDRIRDAAARPAAEQLREASVRVGIWQGLVDGEPDVDAIYRLTRNRPVRFRSRPPVVLGAGTLSPFNSQNTVFRRETFPLLYLPAFVPFRYTDILRGWVAQPILWAAGYRLGFTAATVVQERNPHDLMADFASEIPGYLQAAKVTACVQEVVRADRGMLANLEAAYLALHRRGLVSAEECRLVAHWRADLKDLGF